MPIASNSPASHSSAWRRAYWALWSAFVLTAALNLLQIRAGLLSNHGADLVVPALLYVLTRRYPIAGKTGSTLMVRRIFGSTPELAALCIFGGSVATELCQRFWPHGIFPGTYDPLDILAYGVSVGLCYLADRWAIRQTGLPSRVR